MIGKVVAVLVAFATLLAPAAAAQQKGTSPQSPALQEAVFAFARGDSEGAQAKLENLLSALPASDVEGRIAAVDTLLDLCALSYDEECVAKHFATFLDLTSRPSNRNQVQQHALFMRASYYAAFVLVLTSSPATLKEQVPGRLLARPDEVPFDVGIYLKRHLLESQMHRRLNDRASAIRALDKALSLTATITDVESRRFDLASALAEAIWQLADLGEVERAYSLYTAAADFIRRTLPEKSISAAAFRTAEAQLLQELGQLQPARAAAEIAIATLNDARLEESTRTWLLAENQTSRAVICVLLNDVACAENAIERHPYTRSDNSLPPPQSRAELAYYSARALVGAAAGRDGDPRLSTVLGSPSTLSDDPAEQKALEAYRLAGLALSKLRESRSADFLRAGQELVSAAKSVSGSSPGTWYQPGAIDRLVLTLALEYANQPLGDEEQDALFQIAQLLDRRGRQLDTDSLTALARAPSEIERQSIHHSLRLRARRDELERALHRMRLAPAFAGDRKTALIYDTAARLKLRNFSVLIGQHQKHAWGGSGAGVLPVVSAQQLQRVLKPDEAAISVVPLLGTGVAYLCARPAALEITHRQRDLSHVPADMKLLQMALSADRAVSDELDSQYPAEAAVRMYKTLLEPFEKCLADVKDILWLVDLEQLPLPLAALLEELPARNGDGYDLRTAKWVALKHNITYAGSAAAIVANRSRPARLGTFGFLGVGNPVVGGRVPSGPTPGLPSPSGSGERTRAINLEPLPETEAELIDSASHFQRSTILTARQATEARLRSELMGSYRALSFATHGLIRNEFEGLAEPALLLTPPEDGSTGDRTLTASEIADLTLNARFVALSACNTANLDVAAFSSELPALASAFAIAGVPATLATLWRVETNTARFIVAETFKRVAESDANPVAALGDAQRTYLARQSRLAFFHPRFWAPFIILGDGGVAATPSRNQSRWELASAETVTRGNGEILSLVRDRDGISYENYITAQKNGRHGAGLRARGPREELWRVEDRSAGASDSIADLGDSLLVTRYTHGGTNRPIAHLSLVSKKDGKVRKRWSAGDLYPNGSIVTGISQRKDSVFVAVVEWEPAQGAATRSATILQIDKRFKPRQLFQITIPLLAHSGWGGPSLGFSGDTLLVAYSDPYGVGSPAAPKGWDDFEMDVCLPAPKTWVEKRDLSGRILARSEIPNFRTHAFLPGRTPLIGGARSNGCIGAERASIMQLSVNLAQHEIYRDTGVSGSFVRDMAVGPNGQIIATAQYNNVVDQRGSSAAASGTLDIDALLARTSDTDQVMNGRVLIFRSAHERPSSVPITAGSDVFLAGIAADSEEILIGGASGEAATLFKLRRSAGR